MKAMMIYTKKISFLIWVFLLLCWTVSYPNSETVIRIKMLNSTTTAQLRGVNGFDTAGEVIQGVYDSGHKRHRFTITKTGPYQLWFDNAGGSNYTLDTKYGVDGGNNAKWLLAGDVKNNISSIKDSTISLSKMTQSALDFIGSGGSITNNPDDVSLETKPGSKIGIKDTYFIVEDTVALKTLPADTSKMIFLKSYSAGGNNGGGWFVATDSILGDPNSVFSFSTGTVGKMFYRSDILVKPKTLQSKWMIGNVSRIFSLMKANYTLIVNAGNHPISKTIEIPDSIDIIGEPGAVFVNSGNPDTLLKATGIKGDTSNLSSLYSPDNFDKYVVVKTPSKFSLEDWVITYSDGLFRRDTSWAEQHQIKSISNDTLFFYRPIVYRYDSTTAYVQKINYSPGHIKIKGIKFKSDGSDHPFSFSFGNNITVEECQFDSTHFLYMDTTAYVKLNGNFFTNSREISAKHCIFFQFNNNTVENHQTRVVQLFDCDYFQLNENNMSDVNSIGFGIWGSMYGTANHNSFSRLGAYGIDAGRYTHYSDFSYNIFNEVGPSTAISINRCVGNNITGNKLHILNNNVVNGMTFEAATRCIYSNNILRGWGASGQTSNEGIVGAGSPNEDSTEAFKSSTVVEKSCPGNIVKHNIFENLPGTCIVLSDTVPGGKHNVSTLIEGNLFKDSWRGVNVKHGNLNTTLLNNRHINTTQDVYIVRDSTVVSDKSITTDEIDLSGSAATLNVWSADQDYALLYAVLVYTEASSSDTGVNWELGIMKDNGDIDDDWFISGTPSGVSKSRGSKEYYNYDNFNSHILERGSTIRLKCVGGKTGAGQFNLILKLARIK